MNDAYVLKRPIITESSMAAARNGSFTFEVSKSASKGRVKQAVEEQFGVEVVGVRTMNMVGKRLRTGKRRQKTVRADGKKAIVTLKKGQKIDLFEVES